MSNSDKFLSLFNRLTKRLEEINQSRRHQNFRALLAQTSRHHQLVREHFDDLKEMAELRTAIVHKTTRQAIAEPSNEVVEQLQQIYTLLTKPPTVMSIASHPVYTCDLKDLVVSVVAKMATEGFEHVPVYERGKFIGVFSGPVLFKWLAAQRGRATCDWTTLDMTALKSYLDSPGAPVNGYKFVGQKTDVFAVQDDFLAFANERQRLGAVFVTKTGRSNEKIVGVVASGSLPKIRRLI